MHVSICTHEEKSQSHSLIPRTPAGTAATSAFDRIACMRLISLSSASVRLALFSKAHSLTEAAGAKLGMPLTVPWPPHCCQGVKSAISPSRSKKGYGRDALIDGVELMVCLRRTSLAMLPPQLRKWSIYVQALCIKKKWTYVNFTPHRFEVRKMTASIMADDMSKPAEFAGKL